MTTLLYVQASPRGADSVSTTAAKLFLKALPDTVTVSTLDLFATDLPEFGETLAGAKQKTMFGQDLDPAESQAWGAVVALVEQFKAADNYLLSVPMWNLSIPYKLKQYIDLITHPGLTFMPTAEGMQGLASGRACVIYSRGGDYSPKDGAPDPYDFQSVYLKAWLAMVGISDVDEVLVQRTLAGPEALQQALANAGRELQTAALKF
ncbi:MAG: FMN-dependent NADH-azoreductase [Pseudomonadales bacterium]